MSPLNASAPAPNTVCKSLPFIYARAIRVGIVVLLVAGACAGIVVLLGLGDAAGLVSLAIRFPN
jgi:hypothetical protein